LAIILLAELVRAFGLVFLFESAERYALVLTIAGLVLFIAGREIFRNLKWHLAFLLLMVPLPGQVHNLISGPLRGCATGGAVIALELIGITVMRDGNLIVLNHDTPLAVAEACSGLRMLTAFVFTAAVMAFLIHRPPWQKAVLLLSSVPIALACNLLRLVATAVLFLAVSGETAERFFHDFAGLTMMPLAILMLLFVLWMMNRLVTTDLTQRATSKNAMQPGRTIGAER
jgi:exosortase